MRGADPVCENYQGLLDRIERRERLYVSRVAWPRREQDRVEEVLQDLRNMVQNVENEPVSVPANVLVYDPHDPVSREFHLREGRRSPIQKKVRTQYMDRLMERSVSPRTFQTAHARDPRTAPYVAPLYQVKRPVRALQVKKTDMCDRTTFMRALLSPVRKSRSPVRRSAAGPMRDFQVCKPLGKSPERTEDENAVESDLETDAMRLSTARPAARAPGAGKSAGL